MLAQEHVSFELEGEQGAKQIVEKLACKDEEVASRHVRQVHRVVLASDVPIKEVGQDAEKDGLADFGSDRLRLPADKDENATAQKRQLLAVGHTDLGSALQVQVSVLELMHLREDFLALLLLVLLGVMRDLLLVLRLLRIVDRHLPHEKVARVQVLGLAFARHVEV